MIEKPFVTTASIKQGKLGVRNRAALEQWASSERDGEYTVTVERLHAIRSLESNALYWAGYVTPLSEHTGYTRDEMHAYLKARFMPTQKRRRKTLLLHNQHGEIIDEYEIDLSTTTTLNKLEFSDYLRDIGIFAGELGVEVGTNREVA